MKQPFGIFTEAEGEVKFLFKTSVRFSRANWAALKAAQSHPGVFFAHFDETNKLLGQRHKPIRHSISEPTNGTLNVRRG